MIRNLASRLTNGIGKLFAGSGPERPIYTEIAPPPYMTRFPGWLQAKIRAAARRGGMRIGPPVLRGERLRRVQHSCQSTPGVRLKNQPTLPPPNVGMTEGL